MSSRNQHNEIKKRPGMAAYDPPASKPSSWVRRYRDSDAWLWAEVATVVVGLAFIIPTAIALWVDLSDRKTQRIAQAWELVTRVAPGNSGKGPALEYLNKKGVALVGLELTTEEFIQSRLYLENVDLSGANLRATNMRGANLKRANLSQADLREINLWSAQLNNADLSGSELELANLEGADLTFADLSSTNLLNGTLAVATLNNTDLSGASLWGVKVSLAEFNKVNVSGANLMFAIDLTQAQLDDACGDKQTKLPSGLKIKNCPEE